MMRSRCHFDDKIVRFFILRDWNKHTHNYEILFVAWCLIYVVLLWIAFFHWTANHNLSSQNMLKSLVSCAINAALRIIDYAKCPNKRIFTGIGQPARQIGIKRTKANQANNWAQRNRVPLQKGWRDWGLVSSKKRIFQRKICSSLVRNKNQKKTLWFLYKFAVYLK